ncbi:MAG: hypothetical protein ACPK85_07760 [Methanosarcina sp.]
MEACTIIQETKEQIEDLISESENLMEALRKFFYSVPIQCDPFLAIGPFTVSDLPKMWDYDFDMVNANPYTGEPDPLHYRWFKLTKEQFLEQEELFRKYITWTSAARSFIEELLPAELALFDEKSEIVRKWIEMSERLPSDDNAEMFLRFRRHFVSQQNIVSSLLGQINK